MKRLGSWIKFVQRFSWPFALAMGLAALLDRTLPEYDVPKAAFHATSLLLVALTIAVIDFKFDRPARRIRVKKFYPTKSLLVVETDDVLSTGMLAMIYHNDGELQLQIGVGEVESVTQHGLVQIKMTLLKSVDDAVVKGLQDNQLATLQSLVLIPGIQMVNYGDN